ADDSSIEPWCDFVNRLGAFYQMVNDFFDWRRDREYGVNTYVQSEWRRRRRPCESLEMWFAREGFDWGQAVLGELVSEARLSAAALKSEEALDWISRREELLARESHQLAMGVTGMRHVLQFFASRKPPMGKSTSGGSEREAEAALGK
ncbi:MAG: hypothetical protein IT435_02805, partial [Phycisphaerales bacterium]|nr:hypothetical protein [Phycisphaerales bacterium]